jgi:hypothetical protein
MQTRPNSWLVAVTAVALSFPGLADAQGVAAAESGVAAAESGVAAAESGVAAAESGVTAAGSAVRKWAGDVEKLVFQEDFASPESVGRFEFASPEHWQRVEVAGGFALAHTHAGNAYQPPHRSPHNIALIAGQQFGSFVLDFETQQIGREYGHRDACVFFNFVDPAHFYYTHIATKSDPHAHQIFTVNDAPRTMITQKGTDGFDWGAAEKWHQVRIVRDLDSGLIEVYVNDMTQPIMTAHDTTHGWGRIGVGSFDDEGRVRNIRVYADQTRETNLAAFPK